MQDQQAFLNIKEASRYVGKHPDTIRRLIKAHKTSSNIVKGRQGQYLINTEWLKSLYDTTEAPGIDNNQPDDKQPTENEKSQPASLYEALSKQLEAKDRQIDQLQQIILEKEANTTKLQDQFQQLLASRQLQATNQPTPAEVVVTHATDQAKPGKKTKTKANPTKQGSKPAKKPEKKRKGIFGRFKKQ